MTKKNSRLFPIPLKNIEITDQFWAPRCKVNEKVGLPVEYDLCKETGRIDAFKWKPGIDPSKKPHHFWDSDVAKWIEACAYLLMKSGNDELEQKIDSYIDMLAEVQLNDGYLNSYYITGEIEQRWTNLGAMHELYCAGHLIEAAVAYHIATGKRKFLDIMCRYADHIDSIFGSDKLKGYPGHEEIELALVKLYHATNRKKYLDLAKYFIDERGQQPLFFDKECEKLDRPVNPDIPRLLQAHIPVRNQDSAEGHSVRAAYLYAGMVDIATETNDENLWLACKKIWDNIVNKRMYLTGGIGSWPDGERFSVDYHLPNISAYAETCAAIGLIFFTHRMLQAEPDGKYADVIERIMYNGMLSGVGLSGKHFFYANPLESKPELNYLLPHYRKTQRQEWFDCSCCPTNIARLLASLGTYIYSADQKNIFVHLYIAGTMRHHISNQTISLKQETNYPWDGNIKFTIELDKNINFALNLRIPGWCEKYAININGKSFDGFANTDKGYLRIERDWQNNDFVELSLNMPVEVIESNTKVSDNIGCVAIQRGPLVYCLEEKDNGSGLHKIKLPLDSEFKTTNANNLFDGALYIDAKAYRIAESDSALLYHKAKTDNLKPVHIRAIPYFLWANRGSGEMRVWIHAQKNITVELGI